MALRVSVLSLLLAISAWVSADKIVLAADQWCPINCDSGSDREGYMVDVARAIFERHGHELEYRVIPWNRSIQMAREGKINGVIGPYVEDCPDFIFPENELGMIGFSLFVHQDSSWRYDGISSLDGIKLAVAADYSYGALLDRYVEEHKNNKHRIQFNYGESPVENNIRMLLSKRVDAVIAAEPVFLHLVNRLGYHNTFVFAGVGNEPKKSYIAFSPELDSSESYAALLSDGMANLRASGELERILAGYGLSDWKAQH